MVPTTPLIEIAPILERAKQVAIDYYQATGKPLGVTGEVGEYGRIIAICFKDTEDLNRWMVASGWAVAYRKYSLDYVADEERAHRAKVGIWSGTFAMPWDWRLKTP